MAKSVDCKQCHVDDSFQNVKQLASFDQSCASCHENDIQSSITGGLELLSLPLLDVDALESAGVSIGEWPEDCTGDFDGRLTPLTKLLLLNDERAQKAIAKLEEAFGDAFEFGDIDPENREQVRAAADIVWALKGLLFDLAAGNPNELQGRVSNPDDQRSRVLAQSWSQQFDAVSARQAIFHWMPNLDEEIEKLRRKQAQSATRLNARIAKFSRSLDDELLAENPLQKLMAESHKNVGQNHNPRERAKDDRESKEPKVSSNSSQEGQPAQAGEKGSNSKRGLSPAIDGTIPNRFFQDKQEKNKTT